MIEFLKAICFNYTFNKIKLYHNLKMQFNINNLHGDFNREWTKYFFDSTWFILKKSLIWCDKLIIGLTFIFNAFSYSRSMSAESKIDSYCKPYSQELLDDFRIE